MKCESCRVTREFGVGVAPADGKSWSEEGKSFLNEFVMQEDLVTLRMNVTSEAIDETGLYIFKVLTQDAEKLLEAKASSLYTMPQKEKQDYLIKIRATPVFIHVGARTTFSDINRTHKYRAGDLLATF